MGEALTAMRSRARKTEGKKVDPLTVALETIEVPRAWIREHGWPDTYDELDALVHVEPGFVRHRGPRQELVWQADDVWQRDKERHVAYFQSGTHGEAFLYAQAWRGAA